MTATIEPARPPTRVEDGERPTSSYSELTHHRRCPQAWMYGHHRKLERIESEDAAVERSFGSWWHLLRAADALDRGRRRGSLKALPRKLRAVDDAPKLAAEYLTVAEVRSLVDHWWVARPPAVKDLWVGRIGEELPARLNALYARWWDEWGDDIRNERPLAVELFWRRPLPSLPSVGGSRVDPGMDLIGFIDEVYLDVRRNLVVVRDDKAAKSLASQTAADDMMDSQLQLYAWGAAPIITGWGHGQVRATAYDRARMVRPTTPVVTQMGNLSKSVTDYDAHTYIEWCSTLPAYPGRKKDGSDAGVYRLENSVLDKLRTPAARSVWFQRTLVPLNVNLIRSHLRAAVDSAVELQVTAARAAQFHEVARNLSSTCRWCDFVKLCRAEMVGGPGPDSEATMDLADFGLRPRTPRKTGR